MIKRIKTNKRKLNDFILRIIKWLANNLTKSSYKDTTYAMRVAGQILRIIETRGKAEAIRYTKDLRLKFLTVILMTNETFDLEKQSRLPKILRPMVKSILEKKEYPLIRLFLSVLSITRFLRLEGDISTDTIEKGPCFTGTPSSIEPEIYDFLKDLGLNPKHFGKVPKNLCFKEFHMTSKAGPNGHALWSSFIDIESLNPHQLQAIKVVGGERLYDLMNRFYQLYMRIRQFFDSRASRKGSPVSRRLTKILDKEGKIREVAIGDYYSQAALLPLHKYLMKLLSRIHQDCTADQTKLFYKLENSIGSSYHSIDLTAFTDRFPIVINHLILKTMFGEEYANSWRELMIGTPFHYKGRLVTYATGNPMGLYSSWASTTLAHHFIVWKAAKRCNLNWRRCRYMLLGDDIVIANDRLADAYKDILSEWGVDINYQKTHNSPYGFEFAKQIRLHGVNVSPFPVAALFERRSEAITSLGIILSELIEKDWLGQSLRNVYKGKYRSGNTTRDTFLKKLSCQEENSKALHLIGDYFFSVLLWQKKRVNAFKPTLGIVISLLRYLQGEDPSGFNLYDSIEKYVRATYSIKEVKWENPLHPTWFSQWLAIKVVHRLYEESRDRIVNPSTKGTLGELATEMVINITSLRDGGADCFDLIESVPFLQVYGRAEEVYLDSKEEFLDLGLEIKPKELRNYIGKVDIPLSDDGFYIRHRDVLIVQTMKSSKILRDLLSSTTRVTALAGGLDFQVPWAHHLKS